MPFATCIRDIVGLSFLKAFGAVPALLALTSVPPAPAPDSVPLLLTRLSLDLEVDYERGTVGGAATLTVRNTSSRPVASVPLLLSRLMAVARATDGAGKAIPFDQRITVFGDDSSLQVNAIRVTPRSPLRAGDTLVLTLRYRGILVGYTETGSLYIRDHVAHDFTIIREDAYAFPVLGAPSWSANRSIPREPFAFTARITAPADLVVAMGGAFEERVQHDSLATWSYRSTEPVPFLNITIAPYQVLEGPTTRILYFPADSAGARLLQEAVSSAVERFTRWFGSLPTAPHLVIMEIPEGFGSQASLTAGIIMTADAFRDRSALHQVYHELSHLWNVTDTEHPSPRWNEGLASFLEWRMAAELDGWESWDELTERVVTRLVQRCAPPAPCNTIPLTGYGRANQTDRSYSVGLLMFYALYRALGADRFDAAYRGFFQHYQGSGASTEELAVALRQAGPESAMILGDWLSTTRWYARLASGEPFDSIVGSYRPH